MENKIVIPITGDSSGFKNVLAALAPNVSKSMMGVGAALAVGAVALYKFGTDTIRVGSTFEKSMADVSATMGITASDTDKNYRIIEKAAESAGATTAFTASQAADALNYLALAGYNAKDAAKALPTVLTLAAAGNMDLAQASDLVTDSMSALGLGMKDMTKFTDKMAKTAQKSNTTVSQLGEAILTVAVLLK